MTKRSECKCSCHEEGRFEIHCTPCCHPDDKIEGHATEEPVDYWHEDRGFISKEDKQLQELFMQAYRLGVKHGIEKGEEIEDAIKKYLEDNKDV